jgi:hypothetical protein
MWGEAIITCDDRCDDILARKVRGRSPRPPVNPNGFNSLAWWVNIDSDERGIFSSLIAIVVLLPEAGCEGLGVRRFHAWS